MKLIKLSGILIVLIILSSNSSLYSSDGDNKKIIPIGLIQSMSANMTSGSINPLLVTSQGIDYEKYPTKRKAILLSLLLPGLGEKSIGSHTSSKIFHSSESALWLSLIWNMKVKKWKKEDFEVFASANAGVDINGKDNLFFANVGGYNSVEDYNAARRRSRDPANVYSGEEYDWHWNSNEARLKFRSLRFDSERAQLNIEYTIGFLILNRILSVMNTSYRYGKNQMIGRSIESAELKISPRGTPIVSMNFIF